jgi:hypothetical protein
VGEKEEQRQAHASSGHSVGITPFIALEQSVPTWASQLRMGISWRSSASKQTVCRSKYSRTIDASTHQRRIGGRAFDIGGSEKGLQPLENRPLGEIG